MFEGFEKIRAVEEVEHWDEENLDEIEPMDSSPWADSDRDYSYEEVGGVTGGGEVVGGA